MKIDKGDEVFILGGFQPNEMDTYMRKCIERLPEGAPKCIKGASIDPEGEEIQHLWMWVEGESINGIHVRQFAPGADGLSVMSIYVPQMSSGVDIYMAYALMNVISEMHSGVWVRHEDENGNPSQELADIGDDARDMSFFERLQMLAIILNHVDSIMKIPCMAGLWGVNIPEYRKSLAGKPIEEQVEKLLFDIVDYTWYHKQSDDNNMNL